MLEKIYAIILIITMITINNLKTTEEELHMDEQGDTNQFIPICMHKFCTSPEKNEKTTQKKITVVQAITYHPEFFMRSIKYPRFTKADLKFTWRNILDPN